MCDEAIILSAAHITLFLVTTQCLIDRWTVAPGDTGSTLLFYARVTDIVLGVIIVLFFDLMFPW